MSPKGQPPAFTPQSLEQLTALPRPVYGHVQALPNVVLGYRHAHPWGQLSYAIRGVLEVHSDQGFYLVPPQRAVWVPAQVQHRVSCAEDTCLRSLYLEQAPAGWSDPQCRVIAVNPLLRELIRTFSELPVEYDTAGPDGRLAQVLLDQLGHAEQQQLMLPLPLDHDLRALCRHLQAHPDSPTGLTAWAQQAGVSEKTLSRRLQRETGLSFRLWRQRTRLLSALPALERGERVTDVALACGYESLSAFIAAFGKQFGLPPGEFFRARISSSEH
ncbi:AraC family transcriptional regulator [Pseudomonas donghuensis]|uniref:Helix-turn-helix transcriptional regulator n=1 Tax=Pseudomonas donghuensis TaxID=1163398 RepID=A0AAP0SE25_9PSED|nr:helix-turn-helix transcriptional regulator [Pseudomonas donghuensis]KDN98683.1 helix-turn-helix transcriptional regulator [Pseudomonas donghuensis]MCP6691035.1 helix-turn-helix transcriptional regulator [Pseudomonas donghuensis]MDF9893101.1 AraC-like DNA-binding protein [Pseudomonas vranovensis]